MRDGRDERLICCFLPHGKGVELQARLFSELDLSRVDLHSARGFMGADPAGLFNRVEKEVCSVVVAAERAEEVFTWLYHQAQVAETEGRFLYMVRLDRATPFVIPADVPLESGPGSPGAT